MNKSTKFLFLLFLALGIAYILISKKPWRTAAKAADAFSIKDTAAVTKIFLANKRGEKILLQREANNQWLVNGKFVAEEPKIKLLLATLNQMQIQMPVSESMHNTAIGILASRGVKTEIYAGDHLIKTIYVGSETPDKTGTFMMLEGEDEVYAIHIPGFVGFLTPRFFLTEVKWRSKLLFDIPAAQIAEIQMDYQDNAPASFTYTRELFESKESILNGEGDILKADTMQIKLLLHSFTQKYVEGYYDDSVFTKTERDSLFKLKPYCRLRVKQIDGEYGQSDICMGVPVTIGKNGWETIIDYKLTADEQESFNKSAEAVRNMNVVLKEIGVL
jgi:hypothetical protein